MKQLSVLKRKLRRLVNRKNSAEYVNKVMQQTGWTKAKTIAEMQKAEKLGFSYAHYVKHRLWLKDELQMEKYVEYQKEARIKLEAAKEEDFAYILQQTGWSKAKTKKKLKQAKRLCGASLYDYTLFKMWNLSEAEQKTFYTQAVFDCLFEKYNTNPASVQILVYKVRFAKEFGDLMNRRWFTNGTSLTWENFHKKISGLNKVFAKATASTKGYGAEMIDFNDFQDDKELYNYMKSKSYTIFEEAIKQHPAIAAINKSSVNTIRVVTIVDSGICHHVFTSFRIGMGKIVDNFSAGGIVADIDPENGIVRTDAFNRIGERFSRHPISGHSIKNFQIPMWDEVLKITTTAALRMAAMGVCIVGWDVAVGSDKVYLIEGNSRPGHELPQLPYVDIKQGVRSVVEPFLSSIPLI